MPGVRLLCGKGQALQVAKLAECNNCCSRWLGSANVENQSAAKSCGEPVKITAKSGHPPVENICRRNLQQTCGTPKRRQNWRRSCKKLLRPKVATNLRKTAHESVPNLAPLPDHP